MIPNKFGSSVVYGYIKINSTTNPQPVTKPRNQLSLCITHLLNIKLRSALHLGVGHKKRGTK